MDIHNKAIAILQLTDDGDLLSPTDLKILEMAVNGYLNEAGVEYFDNLHALVTGGQYESPYRSPLHGIEHLSIDTTGYVSWKGVRVKHYNIPWAFGDGGKEAAEKLAQICRAIESEGAEVNSATVWNKFGEEV